VRIELQGVTKRFARSTALDNVDLVIPRGARVALLGPNGSGKTTLTRAIMGLVRFEGEIRIDGHVLTNRMAVASRLAYVPQVAPLMAASVGDVIRTVCDLRCARPAVIAAIANDFGLDVAAVRTRPLRNLSGGMRQKLLLALALATPAELVVLDEPTASLDPRARARFLERFAALEPTTTVILCSHRLDELRTLVDHVVALTEGRVVHDGPADAYLAGRLAAVLELRYRGTHRWLVDHGFERGAGDWWTRVATPVEKLVLLPAALAALGPELEDLVVRDADRIELERHAA
jgi:ABC-2 type transport system ATP-binding protein